MTRITTLIPLIRLRYPVLRRISLRPRQIARRNSVHDHLRVRARGDNQPREPDARRAQDPELEWFGRRLVRRRGPELAHFRRVRDLQRAGMNRRVLLSGHSWGTYVVEALDEADGGGHGHGGWGVCTLVRRSEAL